MPIQNDNEYDLTVNANVGSFTDTFKTRDDMLTAVRLLIDLPATNSLTLTPRAPKPNASVNCP